MVRRTAGEDLRLAVVNDTGTEWQGEVAATRCDLSGTVPQKGRQRLTIGPRGVGTVALAGLAEAVADPRREVLVARADGVAPAIGYHVRDPELALEPADVSVQASGWQDGRTAPRCPRCSGAVMGPAGAEAAAATRFAHLLAVGEDPLLEPSVPWSLQRLQLAARRADTVVHAPDP